MVKKFDFIGLRSSLRASNGMLGADVMCRMTKAKPIKVHAIREDLDLSEHMNDGVKSLKIVLAADRSIHEGQVVMLE